MTLNKEQTMRLLLLDLCAFAVTQAPEGVRQEAMRCYDEAFMLAETISVPHLQTYSDFMDKISYN